MNRHSNTNRLVTAAATTATAAATTELAAAWRRNVKLLREALYTTVLWNRSVKSDCTLTLHDGFKEPSYNLRRVMYFL
ncbi:hypothetical protein TIFTF001_030645 [Ficus carica]|uniref:Uncharacterized protein n=1 Tax=Ficus carica TaxID=3494 RepID=A0AA88DTY3_FICCA|nr:hypothetical protein TIFTF001_030645 [Ficus carica]